VPAGRAPQNLFTHFPTWEVKDHRKRTWSPPSEYRPKRLIRPCPALPLSALTAANAAASAFSFRLLLAVQFFQRLEFLDQRFVLVFQHCYSILQALYVFLLLSPTFPRRLPAQKNATSLPYHH